MLTRFCLLLLATLSAWAADPDSPRVYGTPVYSYQGLGADQVRINPKVEGAAVVAITGTNWFASFTSNQFYLATITAHSQITFTNLPAAAAITKPIYVDVSAAAEGFQLDVLNAGAVVWGGNPVSVPLGLTRFEATWEGAALHVYPASKLIDTNIATIVFQDTNGFKPLIVGANLTLTGQTLAASGGGGDTLWTNDNGTISANSEVADGASAVAFSLNSSNALFTAGAKIATISNNGTNVWLMNEQGGVANGRNFEFYEGPLTAPGFSTLSVFSEDGIGSSFVQSRAISSDLYERESTAIISTLESAPSSTLLLSASESRMDLWLMTAEGDSGVSGFSFTFGGNAVMNIRPGIGNPLTPYIWNTGDTHASGNLSETANNGTNRFVVTALSGIQTDVPLGATNAHPFKVGAKADGAALVLVATNYIQIEINGVAYKLALVQ